MTKKIPPQPVIVNNGVVPVFSEMADAVDHMDDGGNLCVLAPPRDLAEIAWRGAPPGTRTALENLVRRESLYGGQFFSGDFGIIKYVPLDRVKVVCSTICAITGIKP